MKFAGWFHRSFHHSYHWSKHTDVFSLHLPCGCCIRSPSGSTWSELPRLTHLWQRELRSFWCPGGALVESYFLWLCVLYQKHLFLFFPPVLGFIKGLFNVIVPADFSRQSQKFKCLGFGANSAFPLNTMCCFCGFFFLFILCVVCVRRLKRCYWTPFGQHGCRLPVRIFWDWLSVRTGGVKD